MAKPKATPAPTPKSSAKPAPDRVERLVTKPTTPTKVVTPVKPTQSLLPTFPAIKPTGSLLKNNISTGVPKLLKPVTPPRVSSTLDNYVYQKTMDLSKAKKAAADAAKKNAGRVPLTLENYVYQSQTALSQAKKIAATPFKKAPKIVPDRVERMKPPSAKPAPKKTTTKKTTTKKTTTKKVTPKPVTPTTPPPVPDEVEIPVIDPVPYTPPAASGPAKPDTKTATPDLIMTSDEAFPVEIMTDLLYEDVGGTEILNIARHDLIEGAELAYQQISNIAKVANVAGGANMQSLTQTSEDLFSQFPLKRYQYVPTITDDPSGMNNNVYLNSNGDLVVELSGVDNSYQVELSFQVGTVSDIIY